jgi:hypothetical protein
MKCCSTVGLPESIRVMQHAAMHAAEN